MADDRSLDGAGEGWLLALECATDSASVALLQGGRLAAQRASDARNHAESLLGLVDAVLAETGVELDGLAGFALSIGPGSFTSLRVGLASVKGLAFGADAPVAGVSTLAALAFEAAAGSAASGLAGGALDVAAVLDARRGEVYGGVFRCASAGGVPRAEPLMDEGLFAPAAFASRLPRRCLAVGSGAELYADVLAAAETSAVDLRPGIRPTARAVGQLGVAMLARGEGVAAAELAPRYLRRAEAEELRLARQGKSRPLPQG